MGEPRRTERPPVRAAHLGLGAFHRAHQAWYTQQANQASEGDAWGIAAFTGRSPAAAELLARNDGVYTLLERSAQGDRAQLVQAIVRAVPGADEATWCATIADPEVSVLTVTVTEAGYAPTSAPPARIAAGLIARARAGAGPISVVSCDNLLANGRVLRSAVLAAAGDHADAVADVAVFVDTVVDRITPAVTADDLAAVSALTGRDDPAAVVTEPFSEWVLAGEFPGGRPSWEHGGARFVDDVTPYEHRKLWLLNAGHSFLAAAGRLRGFDTVAQAFADARLRAETEALWADQRGLIELPAPELDAWLAELRIRFDNHRIAHRLDQIRRDSPIKMGQRVIAPVRGILQEGRAPGDAQLTTIDTWIRSLVELDPVDETTASLRTALSSIAPRDRVRTVIDRLTPEGTLE